MFTRFLLKFIFKNKYRIVTCHKNNILAELLHHCSFTYWAAYKKLYLSNVTTELNKKRINNFTMFLLDKGSL